MFLPILLLLAGSATPATPSPPSASSALELDAIEPTVVPPYGSATLVLRGAGFVAGARVFIESGTAGRFLAYEPISVTAERCEIALQLGFGPTPTQRRIYLRNPDGGTSASLLLRIGTETESAPAAPPSAPPVHEAAHAALPEIRELRPVALPAGRPVELEILGSGFANGAKIELTVNLRAGSSQMPEYGPRLFASDWLDESELALAFDRGFYPTPGVRNLVVVNPDGGRSGVALLRILASKEEP